MLSSYYRKTGPLAGAQHGVAYQKIVTLLLYEKGATDRRYCDLRLAAEMKDAAKFDDIVLSWRNARSKIQNWLFVQVKHKSSMKLNQSDLFPLSVPGMAKMEFSVFKYMLSFYEIEHSNIFSGSKQFVIFTNAGVDSQIRHWFVNADADCEHILKLSTLKRQLLKLKPPDDIVERLYHYGSKEFNDLAESIEALFFKKRTSFNVDLFKKYRAAINCRVLIVRDDLVVFSPRFVKNKCLDHSECLLRRRLFSENNTKEQLDALNVRNELLKQILSVKDKSSSKLPSLMEMAEVRDFLRRLVFAVDQPNTDEMEQIIKTDLSQICTTEPREEYAELAYWHMQNVIQRWLECKDGFYLENSTLSDKFRIRDCMPGGADQSMFDAAGKQVADTDRATTTGATTAPKLGSLETMNIELPTQNLFTAFDHSLALVTNADNRQK